MNDNYILKLNYKTNLNMRDLGKELDVSAPAGVFGRPAVLYSEGLVK